MAQQVLFGKSVVTVTEKCYLFPWFLVGLPHIYPPVCCFRMSFSMGVLHPRPPPRPFPAPLFTSRHANWTRPTHFLLMVAAIVACPLRLGGVRRSFGLVLLMSCGMVG